MASTFADRYGPWALVAGASEGLGEAFSRQLAEHGLNLLLIARRADPLHALAEQIRERHGVDVRELPQDLADPDLAGKLGPQLEALEIGLLVYNAGYSHIAPFLETDLATKLLCVDVNCRGPLVLTSLLAPQMAERGRGGILLMSSMAGFQGSALVSTYAATKAFDTVLGEGLWEELGRHGVDVLSFVAGATRTPNFESQTPEDRKRSAFPMEPAAVAAQALRQLGNGPTRIPGPVNKAAAFVMQRLLPRRAAVRFMSRTTRGIYERR